LKRRLVDQLQGRHEVKNSCSVARAVRWALNDHAPSTHVVVLSLGELALLAAIVRFLVVDSYQE
jgi:hypothetical protein